MTQRRLDQILSSLGYCSRSESRDWIKDERVCVSGIPAKNQGQKVDPATVTVDGEPLDHPEGLLLLLNKPLGLVCSHEQGEGPNVYSLLPERWLRRNPTITSVGRLDKDTTGLLILTDQSDIVHKLTSPKHKVEKSYVATLDKDVSPEEFQKLCSRFASGTLVLEGEKEACAPARLLQRSPRVLELILTEGRYHQVRRMFVSQGYLVVTLHRERLGSLLLHELAPGKWREIKEQELYS
jgi:16S rRNA pseudouridine516 synthase